MDKCCVCLITYAELSVHGVPFYQDHKKKLESALQRGEGITAIESSVVHMGHSATGVRNVLACMRGDGEQQCGVGAFRGEEATKGRL